MIDYSEQQWLEYPKKPVAKKEEPAEEKEEDNPENESKEKS